MKKTIGILAHVDAGKTTLSEQILFHTKAIRKRGRVDNKDSFLDNHKIEKERGITIFSEQAIFNIKDSTYYLLDTPGHIDFSSEMERTLGVLDYAILLINGAEGVQGHTETLWDLLRKHNIPTILFINKVDREGVNVNKVVEDLKLNLSKHIMFIENDLSIEDFNEEEIEFICDYNEELLEKYFNGEYNKALWMEHLIKNIKDNKIFPCFNGSALQDIGVKEFLNNLEEITYTNYNEEDEFSGNIYKIRYDEKGNKITYIKVLSGTLSVKDELSIKEDAREKVNAIRIYNGNKYEVLNMATAGQIVGVTGINSGEVGQGLGNNKENFKFNMVPTLMSKVIVKDNINIKDVLKYFRILEEEDPSLNVVWNEKLQEIQLHIMGPIQLEVLKEICLERFSLNVEFGECKILYKETINNKVLGSGHFEPLRHYAEVRLLMEPNKRGEGITFESKCHVDNLNLSYQSLIKTHVFEREHKGILTGSGLTDVKITLLIGRSHLKHTSGGDFREATYRAIRQGLEKAENILLEPYYKFKITAPLDNMGRILSDIQKLNGEFTTPETTENKVVIKGRGPVATFMNYSMDIMAFTKGKGSISLVFDGYDICHNSEEVIENIGYKKNADLDYTSTSIFCSKGQGYLVEWDNADNEMHCLLEENY